ncbi:hypothetical protein OKA04_22370 [Luteolibacter flavescens]|uniref:Lipoprotein n=1 Tax=Luteolibacter flavescens TaxID=1859460 RepID=A0ABT3FV97_9BACT|nr:hypothetical protein [Luteolibacter flavescens]MCW1887498.1 hypothetical protein [Luteolibacter flavescens]
MKRALQFCGAALLALFTTSCFEQESTVSLNKDGSGTITQTILISAEMVEMAAQSGQDPTKDMVDKKKAEEQAAKMGEGVTVEKVEALEKGGKKGAIVVFAFKDINKVKYSFSDALSGMQEEGAGGPGGDAPDADGKKAAEEPIKFTYKDGELVMTVPQDKAKDGDKKAGEEAKEDDAEDPMAAQMMEMMKEMFKDMRVTFKLEIPGGIAESNASHVSGTTVTIMDVPFGKLVGDPANMKKLQSMKDAKPEEVAAAFKDVEGLKIETKEEIKVKLK